MSEENKTVFDLNDRVSAFGVEGTVISVEYDEYAKGEKCPWE